MKKTVTLKTTIIISVIALIIGSVIGAHFFAPKSKMAIKYAEIEKIIYDNFDGDIDEKAIDENVFSAFLSSLNDKYSYYYNEEETEQTAEKYKGNNDGLGLSFMNINDEMIVTHVHKNSPADKAELKVYDKITGIDNLSVKNDGFDKVYNYIVKNNSGVKLKVNFERNNTPKTVEITTGTYVIETVESLILDGNIGFLRISHFEESTVNQFNEAINYFKTKKVNGIIFDVRNNSGGLVKSVSAILDELLPECNIISAVYKDGTKEVLQVSDEDFYDVPSCVLINAKSASAAELFAENLKEMRGSTLIGEKTFGKGLMQTSFSLKDGSSVRISVAKFYSAKDKNWNKQGIMPDYEIKTNDSFDIYSASNDMAAQKAVSILRGNE